jgi:sugar phosphate isomerase/epimerase
MKLSCLPVSYFPQIVAGRMTVGEWARESASLGLDGVDISILFVKELTPSYLAGMRRQIEDAGLGLIMVTTYTDFTHPQADERKRALEQAGRHIEAAAQLGAKFVRITAGQGHPGIPRDEAIEWSVAGMTQALAFGKANRIELVFENHAKPGAWQYPDFCFPTDIFLELARRMAKTELGINWDTANTIAYGDDPLPVLKQVIKKVVTIHAAETSTRGALNHVLLGTGVVPFLEQFRFLRQAGWDGWICIEENARMGREGVARSIGFVREMWERAGQDVRG